MLILINRISLFISDGDGMSTCMHTHLSSSVYLFSISISLALSLALSLSLSLLLSLSLSCNDRRCSVNNTKMDRRAIGHSTPPKCHIFYFLLLYSSLSVSTLSSPRYFFPCLHYFTFCRLFLVLVFPFHLFNRQTDRQTDSQGRDTSLRYFIFILFISSHPILFLSLSPFPFPLLFFIIISKHQHRLQFASLSFISTFHCYFLR